MEIFIDFIVILCQVLTFAIIIRAILSWFALGPGNPVLAFLFSITEPILAPLRRIVPRIGFLDITPFVAIILLQLLANLVRWLPY